MVSANLIQAALGVAAKVNFGTTRSRLVPYKIESLFHTRPVSIRSSIVKTAAAKPGMESFFANPNDDSFATDEVEEFEPDFVLQAQSVIVAKLTNMYKKCFIISKKILFYLHMSAKSCNFAAQKSITYVI